MPKRDRMCGSKRRHSTKEGACIAAKKALSVGMNVYKCPKCKHWHIGRSRTPTREADRITALLERHKRKLQSRAEAAE